MKLEAKDLIIGGFYKIYANGKYYNIKLSIDDFVNGAYKNFEPAELTEDWLVRCGAILNPKSKIMKSYWLHLKRNLYLNFSDVGTPNFIVSIICVDDNQITDCNIIHNWDYDKEMYLHELQNIYNVFSKNELTIKTE